MIPAAISLNVDLGQVLFGLAALATAIFPILSWLASRKNAREIETVKGEVKAVSIKADELHAQGNSNLQEMKALAREAGESAGNLKGRAEQTQERKDETAAEQRKP